MTQSEPRGVIVCTDTRVTTPALNRVQGDYAKQGRLAKNVHVCYTSSNLGATNIALTQVKDSWSIADIGEALKTAHEQYGGFTELVAVVCRGKKAPQILELMPPQYRPVPRKGVIGIGDLEVRRSFPKNFIEEGRANFVPPSPEELERAARHLGRPVDLRYRIHDAALNVAQALAEAIRISRPLTVSLPIQLTTISNREVKWYAIASSPDSKTWKIISARPQDVRIPRFRPAKIDPDNKRRTAEQLFD